MGARHPKHDDRVCFELGSSSPIGLAVDTYLHKLASVRVTFPRALVFLFQACTLLGRAAEMRMPVYCPGLLHIRSTNVAWESRNAQRPAQDLRLADVQFHPRPRASFSVVLQCRHVRTSLWLGRGGGAMEIRLPERWGVGDEIRLPSHATGLKYVSKRYM